MKILRTIGRKHFQWVVHVPLLSAEPVHPFGPLIQNLSDVAHEKVILRACACKRTVM